MFLKGLNISVWHLNHFPSLLPIYEPICGRFCVGGWGATIWNSTQANWTWPKGCSNGFLDPFYGGERPTQDFISLISGQSWHELKTTRPHYANSRQHLLLGTCMYICICAAAQDEVMWCFHLHIAYINHCFMFPHLDVLYTCLRVTHHEF